ncbi:MAG: HPr family phosphocarrier protein [Nitrospinae bacterium]|nr:HPr family phosphocarrier protein [Nitrospinota bacterium]
MTGSETKVEKTLTLTHKWGLHARPAFAIAKTAMRFTSDIRLVKGGDAADCRQVTELLSLCAENGDTLSIQATGEDGEAAVSEIVSLIQSNFGET